MNKYTIIALALVAILGAGVAGTRIVSAESYGNGDSDLVQRLAERFGLAEADVQEVLDEVHSEHKSQMHMRFEERLTEAVTSGDITEEQKQLILQKHQEMKAERENSANFDSMTNEERKAVMQSKHQELENWAKENDIDLKYLMMKMGHGPHGPMKMNSTQN